VSRQVRARVFAQPLVLVVITFIGLQSARFAAGLPVHSSCRANAMKFEGWDAVQLSNEWLRLTVVPQIGGRLMQVEFAGHPFLFVNPTYKGNYIAPAEAAKIGRWINYGGDKLWPLPEGQGDGHWPGPISDALDDGEYSLTTRTQDSRCTASLQGPPDPRTGLRYAREISIGSDSPEISFHAIMKNASDHPIYWSVQSVTQYDTADSQNPQDYNRNFWAFAPVNANSVYYGGYQVRAGLADDPSFAVSDGLFRLHWLYLENEVWLDSKAGWLAVVDHSSGYSMVETFRHVAQAEYPGKASIILYKNGGALELNERGMPTVRSAKPEQAPYYMEAEINSPMVRLAPNESYAFDTVWFPTRVGNDFRGVTSVGIVSRALSGCSSTDGLRLVGSFAVFFPGKLKAYVFDDGGAEPTVFTLKNADPREVVNLDQNLTAVNSASRISIHLEGDQGTDRGMLGEVQIPKRDQKSAECQ
jgi:hypothetical protein